MRGAVPGACHERFASPVVGMNNDSFMVPGAAPTVARSVVPAVVSDADASSFTASVPCALLFFSNDGVIVQYVIRIRCQGVTWQLAKRFRDVQSLDETLSGPRWKTMFTPESARGALPKLTTMVLGKTNRSLRQISRRRAELNDYFEAATEIVQAPADPRSLTFLRELVAFAQTTAPGPLALLPAAHRDVAAAEHVVFAFFRVPNDVIGDGAARSPSALGLIPGVFVSLPRAIMFVDLDNHVRVALSCDRSERRPETLNRYKELVAFYKHVSTVGDRMPTPEDAYSFFIDRKRAAFRQGGQRASPKRVIPHDQPGAAGDGSQTGTDYVVARSNPLSGGITDTVPSGCGGAFALHVGIVRPARPENGCHLVSSPKDDEDFAPSQQCTCSELAFCTAVVAESARGQSTRLLTEKEFIIDIRPVAVRPSAP